MKSDAAPSTRRLTPVQFDTLAWMVAFDAEHGRPPTQREIAAHFGIGEGTACFRVTHLAGHGLVRTRHSIGTVVLDAGRAVVAGGKEAATMRRTVLPSPEPLPASVPVSREGLDVLGVFLAFAARGEAPTLRQVADALGRTVGGVSTSVTTLKRGGLLRRDTSVAGARGGCVHLTAIGLGVCKGQVAAVDPHGERLDRRRRTPLPEPKRDASAPRAVRAPAPVVTPVVAPLPPVVPATAPAEDVVPVPRGFDPNAWRPVRHPAPPAAAPRPATCGELKWNALTTLRPFMGIAQ